jgi:hypothetical protein
VEEGLLKKFDLIYFIMAANPTSTPVGKGTSVSLKGRAAALLEMSKASQVSFRATEEKAVNFVAKLALTKKRKDQVLDQLIGEVYMVRRNANGALVKSTAWRTTLSDYWAQNNATVDGPANVDKSIMVAIKENSKIYNQVKKVLSNDLTALGYDTVILKSIERTVDGRKQTVDFNIIVPLGVTSNSLSSSSDN